MRIDLANIAGTPGARGRFIISERFTPAEGVACVEPVSGELVVENTGSLLLARGRLRCRIRAVCVRCLAEAELPLEMVVEEEYSTELTDPDVETIDRDDPEESAISDYVLDMHELARQQVVMATPITFVCRPDCRGLCPQCGQYLNEGACECGARDVDPRWDRLRGLLDAGEGEQDR